MGRTLPPILSTLPSLDTERINSSQVARDASRARALTQATEVEVEARAADLAEAQKKRERAAQVQQQIDSALMAAQKISEGGGPVATSPGGPGAGGSPASALPGVDGIIGSALSTAGLGASGVGNIRASEDQARAAEKQQYQRGREKKRDARDEETHGSSMETADLNRSKARSQEADRRSDRGRNIERQDKQDAQNDQDRIIDLTMKMVEAAENGKTDRVRILAQALGGEDGALASGASVDQMLKNSRYRQALALSAQRYAGNDKAMKVFMEVYMKTGDEQQAQQAAGMPTVTRSQFSSTGGEGEIVNGVFIPYTDQDGNPVFQASKTAKTSDRRARDVALADGAVNDRLAEYVKSTLVANGVARSDIGTGEFVPADDKGEEYRSAVAAERKRLVAEIYPQYGVTAPGAAVPQSPGGAESPGKTGNQGAEGDGTEQSPFKFSGSEQDIKAAFSKLPKGAIFINPATGRPMRKTTEATQ